MPASSDGLAWCSACHEPHASDYRYLTRANEEELCYTCHATADPNTANGSNPQNAFTAVPNDYATDDGDGIQIFHHPVAQGEQDGGTRTIECASCHNSHLVTRTETGLGLQATAQDRQAAAVMGIPTERMSALGWAIAALRAS